MQQSLAVKAGQTLLVGFPTEICCLISRAIHKHTHMSFPFFSSSSFTLSSAQRRRGVGWLVTHWLRAPNLANYHWPGEHLPFELTAISSAQTYGLCTQSDRRRLHGVPQWKLGGESDQTRGGIVSLRVMHYSVP